MFSCDSHQTEGVIAVGRQSDIGGNSQIVELQLDATIEIGSE